MKKIISKLVVLTVLTLMMSNCQANDKKSQIEKLFQADLEVLSKYPFVNVKADTIADPSGSMNSFLEQLDMLSDTEKRSQTSLQLSIIHYGDSHIQAGYITEVVRRQLQHLFGNAGRGFVTPLKLASSNEPRDYSITSNTRFESTKITNRGLLEFNPGVGGVAVRASLPTFNIKSLDIPEDSLDYSFNRVVVFHDSLAPIITANSEIMSDDYGSDIFFSYTTNIELNKPQKELELYTYKDNKFAFGPFYGFSLENNNSGILYHSLGVNGACYLHWGLRDAVAKQSVALNPSLIILSMGSNEAAGRNFIEEVFLREVNTFVSQLIAANPNTPILITSPVETLRRSKNGHSPNTNYTLVSNALRKYCLQKKLAYLDMFRIMGGVNSSRLIDKENLLQRDKIHFTIPAYQLQGTIILNAIINEFIKYDRQDY